MIAAGIFAIGLIAVAAIFPTAIQLQKQTFEEIRGDEFSKTVRSLVMQRGFDERLVALRAEEVTTDPVTNPTAYRGTPRHGRRPNHRTAHRLHGSACSRW